MEISAERKAEAIKSMDLHIAMSAMNPGAWLRPRTGRRRYAQPQRPSRVEILSILVGESPKFNPNETSVRGDRQRADWETRKAGVTENIPLKYMHSVRRRAAMIPADIKLYSNRSNALRAAKAAIEKGIASSNRYSIIEQDGRFGIAWERIAA